MANIALAPCVQSVVHEGRPFEQAIVVGFNVQAADADGEQTLPGGVGTNVGADVGGVDDLCQTSQGRVPAEPVCLDERLERAPLAVINGRRVGVLAIWCVKGVAADLFCDNQLKGARTSIMTCERRGVPAQSPD